ncbi:Mov34/MPN/PAD-1 family protein [Gilvimarinus agarilyticus]|uniref:Mov34/MPN/PAD-1 family protein n=1 Tax=Gilvimarinus sp. 2_MG-2023 TaxID=3062666 RepID=UPI001C0A5AE6|nr:Mov34/MPN/PAD-1 family protein [Gilvimarinus sp. 2_MG-2023]MBU2886290.1 Mov34/MPN/PAD-1 family protein [Gilvimarinus agarilyticus]MDO6570976.1 Mov34/MPN/PAD-1 family protein [Gilvimarinus sp. 2_MG-2023]
MIYESPRSVITISADVCRDFLKYRQGSVGKTEACGVLIGEGDIDKGIYNLNKITTPMLRDIRRRTYFKIRDKGHQKTVDNEWKRSSGARFYLGFWHTHPELFPCPSRLDIESWKENFNLNRSNVSSLFYPIVGMKEIAIWECGDFGVTKMNCVSDLKDG